MCTIRAENVKLCRLVARSCSAAVALDVLIPRPGLSSFRSPRADPHPLDIAYTAGIAYEACMRACMTPRSWILRWKRAVREMVRAVGNTLAGALFLLSLQSASIGTSLSRLGRLVEEDVMGSAMECVDVAGTEGAIAYIEVLGLISSSYLWRIGWSGIPDVTTGRLALDTLRSSGLTLSKLLAAASIYDVVSKDAATGFSISFGLAKPLIAAESSLADGVRKATYAVVYYEGDLLLRRKCYEQRELWGRALAGDEEAEAVLWRTYTGCGPGSAADIVINAAAYTIAERAIR